MSESHHVLAELVSQRSEKIQQGKRSDWPYVGLEHLESGSPDLSETSPSSASSSTNNVFRAGDVLFGKLRPYLRKSVRAPFPGYCSTDILVLEPAGWVDNRFVAKVFQSEDVFRKAVATSIGTKMPRTSWQALSSHEVFVPALPEQRRIAEILDTVDEAIRKTEEVIAKLEQMKQGLIHDLLTRGIDKNGELRDAERYPEKFKDSPLGRIPREWEVLTLREVVPVAEYGISKSLNASGDIAVLRMMNFADGEAELSDLKYSNSAAARGLLLKAGDVLFNRTNSIDHVGRTGIWRGQRDNVSFASYLVRLIPNDQLTNEFLNRWLNWNRTQIRIRRFATPGVHQVNINPTNLRRTSIALPPINEQQRITQALWNHDELIRTEVDDADKLRVLKRGLMDDLLTGSVRVNVDATDEAAE